jgi:hypothetical protein
MPNKELIYTDTRRFQADLVKHDAFLQLILESITFISDETKVELTPEDLTRENAFALYMKYFANLHEKANTLNLSGVRLMDLMELDLARIIGIFDKCRVMPHQVKPDIKDYSTYAETEQELERLQTAKEFLAVLKKLDTNVNFTNVYKAPIKFDVYDRNSLIPNHHWIRGKF